MATFPSPAAFGKALGRMERDLERQAWRATKGLAHYGAGAAEGVATSVTGAKLKLSGWPPTFETRVKRLTGTLKGHAVLPRNRGGGGAWTVGEIGRNKGTPDRYHGPGANRKTGLTSFRKDGAVRKVRAFKPKRWNGYTAGWGLATKAVDKMDAKAEPTMLLLVKATAKKEFD